MLNLHRLRFKDWIGLYEIFRGRINAKSVQVGIFVSGSDY